MLSRMTNPDLIHICTATVSLSSQSTPLSQHSAVSYSALLCAELPLTDVFLQLA